jgi:transketolase
MRQAFTRTLVELAERDPAIVLLTGDLGFTVLEPFAERHPERFFNVGVAEQNMVGIATGLAEAGFTPFTYSIVTFATLRPYEFIRNGPVLQRLPVRIVGVGGGLEYGNNGPSHYGLEDIAVMRAQPSMTVLAPADAEQARTCILATTELEGPLYLRLGKDDRRVVPGLDGRFELGRAQTIADGGDVLLVTMGSISTETVAAAQLLDARGIAATIVVVASITPAPVEDLSRALARFSLCVTVEGHYTVGGLGSLVCEVASGGGHGCRVVRCGVDRLVEGISGSEQYLYEVYGLSAPNISEVVVGELGG